MSRHDVSTRPNVFFSMASPTSPPSPPISTSDAGREATSSAPGSAFTASLSDYAKVRLLSNEPAGVSLFP